MKRTTRLGLALLLTALTVVLALPAFGGRGSDADRKSKNGALKAKVGPVEVVVEYGRPQVRGRKIFGSLVPYGKVWRTGADEATTISFSTATTVEGEKVPAGTYALFTIPGEKTWTLILNSQAEQWGAFDYSESKDVLRVDVEPRSAETTEEMTFTASGGELALRWADLEVPIRIGES